VALLDLRWHLRAWRSQSRWARTRAAIADWLAQAPKGHDDLLLFGASAGWMMDDAFLARFRRIDAVDYELAASPLFQLNHRRVIARHHIEVRFHNEEALSRLEQFLSMRPQALVLFDNVLGQYTLTCRDVARAEATLSGLADRLGGRDWGSVHDAVSGPGRVLDVAREPVPLALGPGQAWPDDTLVDTVGATGQWRDHLTRAVLPATIESQLLPWQLAPGYWHWLQAGWVRA
jgi:hypothetical protein